MEAKEEEVIDLLRACLLSAKGGIPLSKISGDYHSLAGEPLPFRQLGYPSLREFCRSVPGLRIIMRGNDEVLEAIPTEHTQHLAQMVARQKSSTTRRARQRKVAPRQINPGYVPLSQFTRKPRSLGSSFYEPNPVEQGSKVPRIQGSSGNNLRPSFSITFNNEMTCEKPTRLVTYRRNVNSWPSQLPSDLKSPTGCISSGSSASSVASDDGIGGKPRLKSVVFKVNNEEPRTEMTNGDRGRDLNAPPYLKYEIPPRLQKRSMTSLQKPVMPRHTEQPPIENARYEMLQYEISAPRTAIKTHAQARLQAINVPKVDLSEEPMVSKIQHTSSVQSRLTTVVKKQPACVDVLPEYFNEAVTIKNGSFVYQLEEFTKEKGLPIPEYKVCCTVLKEEPFATYTFISNVKIGEFSFSSHPDHASTRELAQEFAAKRAMSELGSMYSGLGRRGSVDPNTVMSRVTEITLDYPTGIWSISVPAVYLARYKENLPDDWLEIIKHCPYLTLQYVSDKRAIISHMLNAPVDVQIPASSPPLNYVGPYQNPKEQPRLQSVGAVEPEPLKFPQGDNWDIFVTCATTTTRVWARFVGDEYSVRYDNMASDMELHYAGQSTPVTNPKEGLICAVKIDDCWFRCEVVQIEDKMAEVFFIDHGDEEMVPVVDLQVLERQFVSLPAQAVKFSLRGLESFATDPNVPRHLERLIGKSVVAQVHELPNETIDVVSVTIFDTSTEDDINMNNVLLEAIANDALAPQMPPENHVKEVYVSHVTPTGDVYVHLETLVHLESLMENLLENNIDIINTANISSPDPSQLYLAPYSLDLSLYRASVTKMLDNNKVEVFFVDYGNSEVVDVSSLIPLNVLKKSLAQFPHQALKVHLHNVTSMFSIKMADRLRQLVPMGLPVLMKMVHSKGPTGVPVVELFKRIQPDNILASINNTLALDPELTLGTSRDTVRSSVEEKSLRDSKSDICAPLPAPEIPDIGEYFSVRVTMAANPGNFTVQPLSGCQKLEEMMYHMQEEYNSNKYQALNQNEIQKQGLYAALYTDGNWYRICVLALMMDSTVSVYLCDFGELFVLTPDRLRPLHSRFRKLPCQAIKAKLAGIKPCHLDWSVEDCLLFQEMVVEREFYSIIREVSADANVGTSVISLILIDTSGDKDININDMLIELKRALPISNKC